jgi:hypothetical protein
MRDISKSSSASRPPWRRLVLATALTCGCSGVALAFLPTIVHDPKLDASLTAWYARMESSAAAHHFRQLTELINQVNAQREQIQQFADWRGYMERIHGAWEERIPLPAFRQTKNVQIGTIALATIGWDDVDEWRRLASTRDAADALDQMRAVLAAQRTNIDLRETLETLYGDVPVTQNGAAVEAARRQMGESIAYGGELRRALVEKQAVIEGLKQEIAAGDLPPGDLERKMVLLQAEQIDVQLLLAQTVNQSNQLGIQQLGLQSQAAAAVEMNRLTERERRLDLMQNVRLGMARSASAPEIQ